MHILSQMQRHIEDLFDVSTQLDVSDYVIDDEIRSEIPGAKPGLPEQLFVREEDDVLELALYVDPKIVEHLHADPPTTRLHFGNVENFSIALEGVSHFVLVATRANQGRNVSVLEMEIQAEVDKFLIAWFLLASQGSPMEHTAQNLANVLFGPYEIRDDVDVDEAHRYHIAHRVALRFCAYVMQHYRKERTPRAVVDHARRFFHSDLAEKLRSATT